MGFLSFLFYCSLLQLVSSEKGRAETAIAAAGGSFFIFSRRNSLFLFVGMYETGRNICPLQQLLFHSLFTQKRVQDSGTNLENISSVAHTWKILAVLHKGISGVPMIVCKSGLNRAITPKWKRGAIFLADL